MTPDKFYWVLDESHNARPVDHDTWEQWFKTANRHVAQDFIEGVQVSTVFLAMWHLGGVFETMIFACGDPAIDELQWRYWTWNAAVEGHKRTVELVVNHIRSSIRAHS